MMEACPSRKPFRAKDSKSTEFRYFKTRHQPAQCAADMQGFHRFAEAAAQFVCTMIPRGAHGYFVHQGFEKSTVEGQQLRRRWIALYRSLRRLRLLFEDEEKVGQGLYVVDQGWFARHFPVGERRYFELPSYHVPRWRCQQGGLFTADVSAPALMILKSKEKPDP